MAATGASTVDHKSKSNLPPLVDPIFVQALAAYTALSAAGKEAAEGLMRKSMGDMSVDQMCELMVEKALEKGMQVRYMAPLTLYGALPAIWKPLVDKDAIVRALLTSIVIGMLVQDEATVDTTDGMVEKYRTMTDEYKAEIQRVMVVQVGTHTLAKVFHGLRSDPNMRIYVPLMESLVPDSWNNSVVPDGYIRLWLFLNEVDKRDAKGGKVLITVPPDRDPRCKNPNCPQKM